jgi:hypothetical protein
LATGASIPPRRGPLVSIGAVTVEDDIRQPDCARWPSGRHWSLACWGDGEAATRPFCVQPWLRQRIGGTSQAPSAWPTYCAPARVTSGMEPIEVWRWQFTNEFGKRVESSWRMDEQQAARYKNA